MRSAKTVYLPVPIGDMGLVFDGKRWTVEAVPPAWFLDLTDAGNDLLPPVEVVVELEPIKVPPRVTSCRPGRGPCRRRHEHASLRRAA